MGLLLVSGHAEVWQLVVLQLAGGVATAFHSPATSGLVPQTVPPDSLQQANAFMTLSRYGATILGAAVGGILVATVGSGWAIVLDAGTYAASVALIALMRLPATAKRAEAPHFFRELREGWRGVRRAALDPALLGLDRALLPVHARARVRHRPGDREGIARRLDAPGRSILTGEAVGALLGGIAAIRWRPHRTLVVMGAILGLAAFSRRCSQCRTRRPDRAGRRLDGIRLRLRHGSLRNAWSSERVRPEHLSRVSAYGWVSAMCCLPLGYALAGPAAELVGMDAVLWFGAGWMALSSIVFVALPPIRDVRSGEDAGSSGSSQAAAA